MMSAHGAIVSALAPEQSMKPLPAHGRFDYSPITGRPRHDWPNGTRLAVYLGFNIEHFAFGEGLGAALGAGVAGSPTCSTFAGASTATASAPGAASSCSTRSACPPARSSTPRSTTTARSWSRPASRAATRSSATATRNAERQGELSEADERALLARCRERIAAASGQRAARLALALDLGERASRPTCWSRPATATRSTGATTTSRCAAHARRQAALVDPVSAGAQRHPDDRRAADGRARDFADMIVDHFDEMLEQSREPAAGDGHRAASLPRRPAAIACRPFALARCVISLRRRERGGRRRAGSATPSSGSPQARRRAT